MCGRTQDVFYAGIPPRFIEIRSGVSEPQPMTGGLNLALPITLSIGFYNSLCITIVPPVTPTLTIRRTRVV